MRGVGFYACGQSSRDVTRGSNTNRLAAYRSVMHQEDGLSILPGAHHLTEPS